MEQTEGQIAEGNKLIAIFMGAEKSKIDGDSRYLRFPEPQAGTETFAFYPRDLKYHSLWNWLMPVVEKINTIKMPEPDGRIDVIIYRSTCHINNEQQILFETTVKKSLIECVWQAIIQFIKWYNKNQKP